MSITASDIFSLIMQDLDDVNAIRTMIPAMFLRQATRAQQWIALRYQLLRNTFPFALFLNTPVYALAQTHPRLVVVTHMTHSDGTPLARVPLTSLRYKDPAWFSTIGVPGLFYRIGWRFVGTYPVPSVAETAIITGLLLPSDLLEMTTRLQIPESYLPHLALVTTGLLMLGRERRYEEGIARIKMGLGMKAIPQTSSAPQEGAGVAG